MEGINFWAVLAAAAASFVIGGLWYSPVMFAGVWMREAGLDEARARSGSPALIFGGSFVLSLIASACFAAFLGPRPALGFAAGAGLAAGLCWVAASFGVNYLFERRSLRLFLINGGYHTLQFTVFGLVLGVWH